MSEQECLTADWRTVGYEDGTRGHGPEQIQRHRRACAKVGVTPDFVAYREGLEEGLRRFCRPASGFALGRRGQTYNGACPADLEAEFLVGYRDGNEIFRLEQDVFAIERHIGDIDRQVADAEEEIAELEEELDGDVLDADGRRELREEMRELVTLVAELRRDRQVLFADLLDRSEELQSRLREPRPYSVGNSVR